jgi:hypothetical protein
VNAVLEKPMPPPTPKEILSDIAKLSGDDLTRFCTALGLTLQSLTDGAFEVLPGDVARARRAAFRLALKGQCGQINSAVMRVTEQVLADSRESMRQAAELIRDYRADASSARTEADAAREKEERRKRKPDPRTAEVMSRVEEFVIEYHDRGKHTSWSTITFKINEEFDTKYKTDGLKAMYYRERCRKRPASPRR